MALVIEAIAAAFPDTEYQHRASGTQYAVVCGGERQESVCHRLEDDLPRTVRTNRFRTHGSCHRKLEKEVPPCNEKLVNDLGCFKSAVQVFDRCQEGHLYD